MTSSHILSVALLTIAGLFVVLACAIGVRHFYRSYQAARYEIRSARLRSLMLRLLSDDDVDLSGLDEAVGKDAKLAEGIAWSLLPKIRGAAREELSSWLKTHGAVDRARARARRPGAVGRSRAAEYLGASGVREAAPDVIRLLGDRRLEVRVVAARALGKLGEASAVPCLLDALDGKRAVPVSLISMSLIHIGPSAIDELVRGLGRRSARARSVCAELLGIHGALQAARWLVLLVEHDAIDEVRVRAASALGRLGSPQGVQPLLRAMAPTEPQILRVAAARSLGQIGGSDAISGLHVALLQNDVSELAEAAAEALARLGQRGAEVLTIVDEGEGESALRARDWLARTELESNRLRRRRTSHDGLARSK